MAHTLTKFNAARIAISLAAVLSVSNASAQLTVWDPGNYYEAVIQELNQLDQIAIQNAQQLQQLTDYRLQLQNLQQLSGSLRGDVKQRLAQQLLGNVQDFGRSLLNKTSTKDPNSGSYYVQAEDIISTGIGSVPRSTAATDVDLGAVGLGTGQQSEIGRDAYKDRQQYDRVMDDVRQVAMMRKNSEERATQANAVANEMARLPDNNTVGAIQLLSAQNSLAYAQQEDLLKNQAAALKEAQERQLRVLVEKEELRKRELDRLAKVRANASTPAPTVKMIPGT